MDTGQSIRVGLARINQNRRWLADELKSSEQWAGQIFNGKEIGIGTIKKLAGIFFVTESVFIGWGEL